MLAVLAAIALPFAVITAPSAVAADGPFTVDGVLIPDTGASQLPDAFGNVKELGPKNSNTTKIGAIHDATVPMLDLTNPNGQVDLRRAWLATAKESGHDWLYFAWERDANSGSGFIAYEFMQDKPPAACDYENKTDAQLIATCNPWANRKAGDFMILWDQQGGSLDLFLRTWSEANGVLTLGAATPLNSAVSQAAYGYDGFRGEAALDLTATIFAGATKCLNFANTVPSTVTGNSDTADYKDTILEPSIPISNCKSSTVTTPKLADGTTSITGDVIMGSQVKDSAVITTTDTNDQLLANQPVLGSVSFYICKFASGSSDLCDGTAGTPKAGSLVNTYTIPSTNTLNPLTVVSDAYTVSDVGRYCWRAVYSGDTTAGIPGSSD